MKIMEPRQYTDERGNRGVAIPLGGQAGLPLELGRRPIELRMIRRGHLIWLESVALPHDGKEEKVIGVTCLYPDEAEAVRDFIDIEMLDARSHFKKVRPEPT